MGDGKNLPACDGVAAAAVVFFIGRAVNASSSSSSTLTGDGAGPGAAASTAAMALFFETDCVADFAALPPPPSTAASVGFLGLPAGFFLATTGAGGVGDDTGGLLLGCASAVGGELDGAAAAPSPFGFVVGENHFRKSCRRPPGGTPPMHM